MCGLVFVGVYWVQFYVLSLVWFVVLFVVWCRCCWLGFRVEFHVCTRVRLLLCVVLVCGVAVRCYVICLWL